MRFPDRFEIAIILWTVAFLYTFLDGKGDFW